MVDLMKQNGVTKIDLEDELTRYVQGRLDSISKRRIDARAEKNEVFSQKLDFEKRVVSVIGDRERVKTLGDDSFEALRVRIEAPSLWTRIAEQLLPVHPMQWATASLVVAFVGTIVWQLSGVNLSSDDAYETLGDPETVISMAADRQYARIIFSPETTAEQRTEIAEELGFSITSSPGPQQSWVVSIPRSQADDTATIKSWCEQKRIMYCEPLAADQSL